MQRLDFKWYVPPNEIWLQQAKEFKARLLSGGMVLSQSEWLHAAESGPVESFLTNGRMSWYNRARNYSPLQLAISLFRKFANTALTDEAILQFANTYGLLGQTKPIVIHTSKGESLADAELLDTWKREISVMRAAVRLWDAIKAHDLDALRVRIIWTGDDVHYDPRADAGVLGDNLPELHPDLDFKPFVHLGVFQKGDVIQPALYVLRSILSTKLEKSVAATTTVDVKDASIRMSFAPSSLLAALWLQFGMSIDEKQEFRQCRQCKEWFALAPGTARADKEFCSSACRSKAYRKRQLEARALHQTGLSVPDIAKQLGVEKLVVKKWISDHD